MTMDPDSVVDLAAALCELSDNECAALTYRAFNVANHFADVRMPRVVAVFHALGVLVAEEGDRRATLAEHARVELDGDDTGALVTDPGTLRGWTQAECDGVA